MARIAAHCRGAADPAMRQKAKVVLSLYLREQFPQSVICNECARAAHSLLGQVPRVVMFVHGDALDCVAPQKKLLMNPWPHMSD